MGKVIYRLKLQYTKETFYLDINMAEDNKNFQMVNNSEEII